MSGAIGVGVRLEWSGLVAGKGGMKEKSNTAVIVAIAVMLLVPLGLYVGSYYAAVEPAWIYSDSAGTVADPGYRSPWSRFRVLYGPIHWLDRHVIRPSYWLQSFEEPQVGPTFELSRPNSQE